MDIQVTFSDGPIEAEISAGEDESYTEVLEALGEFVENYDPMEPVSAEESAEDRIEDDTHNESGLDGEAADSSGQPNSFFEEVDATDAELQRVLKMGQVDGEEVKEFPEIIGSTDVLGTSIAERLLNGATIILTILEETHGVSRVRTTELKDALGESGMDVDNWGNVHGQENKDVYLDSRGKGSSGTTAVRAPGKKDAYGYIQALVEDLRAREEDDE